MKPFVKSHILQEMNLFKIKRFALLILMVINFGCEDAFIKNDPANTPVNNFEILWNTLNDKYAYFTYKNIDWDSVYREYRPKINNLTDDKELFRHMADMLNELQDGHVNITSEFDRSRSWNWRLNYPDNFDQTILHNNRYLGNNYRITGPLLNTVIDSIGYVYYSSFLSDISNDNIDFLIDQFADLKGIIIDIRNNGGGNTSNSNLLVSRFLDKTRLVQYEYFKTGPGHDEFSPLQPVYLSPSGKKQFKKPVVVLINRSSYSAATDFACKMSVIPSVTLIGDTTGGGGSSPINYELPNGWTFRFSSNGSTTPGRMNLEKGMPPDIHQDMTTLDELMGIDSIIEKAIRVIEEKTSKKFIDPAIP